jgi:hypothetical protein
LAAVAGNSGFVVAQCQFNEVYDWVYHIRMVCDGMCVTPWGQYMRKSGDLPSSRGKKITGSVAESGCNWDREGFKKWSEWTTEDFHYHEASRDALQKTSKTSTVG